MAKSRAKRKALRRTSTSSAGSTSIATPSTNHERQTTTLQPPLINPLGSPLPSSTETMSPCHRLLIVSLGNPPPLLHTLHSAGHLLLQALAPYARSSTDPSSFVLHQSSSLMNVSGKNVARRYAELLKKTPSADGKGIPGLVVLHDELEMPLGKVKVRRGGRELSDKGHRGVRSVIEELARNGILGSKETRAEVPLLVRIGVGIGRPEGRDREEVSAFVLREMSWLEREKVERAAGEVFDVLDEEARGR